MFQPTVKKTTAGRAYATLELIFHAAVQSIRRKHGNAVVGLLMNIAQMVLFVGIFYIMFVMLGMRGSAVRGDFLLYIMSGIFMFMVHTKSMGAVVGSEGPTSPMMKHAPMNPIISIGAAALSSLYLQILSAGVVLFFYHAVITPITIFDPIGTMGMLLLAWFSGVAIGMIFKAMMPWQPEIFGLISQIYMRGNMIASGKMFLANAMPTYILAYFDWNPLFHIIDQTRGYVFLNYHPRYSNLEYPIIVTIICLVLGLMGEFYTRKHASLSWGAKR